MNRILVQYHHYWYYHHYRYIYPITIAYQGHMGMDVGCAGGEKSYFNDTSGKPRAEVVRWGRVSREVEVARCGGFRIAGKALSNTHTHTRKRTVIHRNLPQQTQRWDEMINAFAIKQRPSPVAKGSFGRESVEVAVRKSGNHKRPIRRRSLLPPKQNHSVGG